jgi:hypothetical protein
MAASSSGGFFICRHAGISPVHYLCISLYPSRDSQSWWVELRENQGDATKWLKEEASDGLVKIYSDLGGVKAYLASHGTSRYGQVKTTGPECYRALVHRDNDKNSLWRETPLPDGGGSILRKDQETNAGFVLTGLCFPSRLQADVASHWVPLPFINVVVEDESSPPGQNQHAIWHFVSAEDASGIKKFKT